MQKTPIKSDMMLFEISESHPRTIPIFVDNGFKQMSDPAKRESVGRRISLRQAAATMKIDLEALRQALNEVAAPGSDESAPTLEAESDARIFPSEGDIKVAGLLPCPVRIPLLEAFESARASVEAETGSTVGYRLAAASVGMDAVETEMARIRDLDDLPDIFVSAGFEAFFDHRNFARFKDKGVFRDRSGGDINDDFKGLGLKDPDGHYAMIGVVPAIFLVDRNQLPEGVPAPRTWSDLLDPRLERRVALPVGDFDLFNGILLTLYKHHGEAGVAALSRNLMTSLHPSQAAGRFKARKGDVPAVSVIPYFFSRMAKMNPTVDIVWPQDGAIISPIFMLERSDAPGGAERIADFFMGPEAGEIMSHRGLFPSLHPDVVNELPDTAPWLWLGWDFIRENDLGALIPRLSEIFNSGSEA